MLAAVSICLKRSGTKGSRVRFIFLSWLVLLLVSWLGACRPMTDGEQTSQEVQKSSAVISGKMASTLVAVIRRMRADGLTAVNAAVRHAERYSTPVVRVDQAGRIQTSISVTAIDETVVTTLATYHARIEVAEARWRIIQAWVPFGSLESLAAQPFVVYIRPPRYAIRH